MNDAILEKKLPVPHIKSGKCTATEYIVSDGLIDWTSALHLWVHGMHDQHNNPLFAPCVVFFDDTWAMVGPLGDLEQARKTCHRLAAIHDSTVSDNTRPERPKFFTPEEMTVDVMLSDLGDVLPGDPWAWNETDGRFRLNLAALGADVALGLTDRGLDAGQKIAALDKPLAEIEKVFRSCDAIQPHLVRSYLEKIRQAAMVWIRETSFHTDELETPEDDGRMLVDEIRRDGVTVSVRPAHLLTDSDKTRLTTLRVPLAAAWLERNGVWVCE
ncbi:hypothetical protein AA0472_2710 [Acetobacter estunensis NRIC 0472]|uniref:Uncharacterized protein n=1 Tax=Acetobacter estunensis TaxID=104097 RepID=A0A967B350_9PROT|nr:hypothetical protein [Acetobacter estunensis]NHO52865.1 hypothetical protein [Acetobacter estunensis]GBQ28452.1 hypothetical protein AA0472_2710 [Acetobacter estunensis NRIC 0472]